MNVSVSAVITRGLLLSDEVKSRFITDLDKHDAINAAYRDTYNSLLDNNDDYYATALTGSYTGTIPLPADFMRLRMIDYLYSNGVYRDVPKYPIKDRNNFQFLGTTMDPRYRVQGSNILIKPDNIAYNFIVTYYPMPLALVSNSISAWGTGLAYTVGNMVSNGGSYYGCVTDHTAAALFSTDLAAGKWYLYADSTAITSITYPNNLVYEILEYSCAIEFKRKGRELDKIGPLQQRLAELWERYTKQIVRDDDNYERINSHYGKRFGARWV